MYLQTSYHMTNVKLILLLIGILGLYWVLQRYGTKPLLDLGAAVIYLLTIVMLLSMGAWQHDGFGVKLVLLTSTVAACRHGWRYYNAKSNLAS